MIYLTFFFHIVLILLLIFSQLIFSFFLLLKDFLFIKIMVFSNKSLFITHLLLII